MSADRSRPCSTVVRWPHARSPGLSTLRSVLALRPRGLSEGLPEEVVRESPHVRALLVVRRAAVPALKVKVVAV